MAAVAPHSGLSLDGKAVRRDAVLNKVLSEDLNNVLGAVFAACFAAACIGNAPAHAAEQQAAHVCGGNEIARGTVSRIVDGRTFVLDDGREIRLAAVEVPPMALPE
jgi:endonuclease YncB( thermonuclease family)